MKSLVLLFSILFPLANAHAVFAPAPARALKTAWERTVKAFCGTSDDLRELRSDNQITREEALLRESSDRICAELLAQSELSPPLLLEIQLFMERVERPQQWRGDDRLPSNRIPPGSARPDRYTPNPLNPDAPPRLPPIPPGGGPRCPDNISPQVMRPQGCWPIN